MHVTVKELAPVVQKALKSVNYGAADIRVEAANEVDAYSEGNAGSRGFVIVLNVDTGETRTLSGNWGGGSIAGSDNLVDSGSDAVTLPENGIVIKGSRGYPRTFATIYAHPNAVGAYLLPSGEDETLTDAEQQALYCFGAIKGGEYRRDEMRRRNVSQSTVDSLVTRGYLKRNRAGATQITTKGKNARTIRN
jgi:hypothetical protein